MVIASKSTLFLAFFSQRLCTRLLSNQQIVKKMPPTVKLIFKNGNGGELIKSDPRVSPVIIIGKTDYLKKLAFDDVKCKLEPRVTDEEHFKSCIQALHPTPTDSCSLYMNYANVVALSSKPVSRHNSSSRAVNLKVVKSFITHTENEYIVLVCPRRDVLPCVAALSRAFPLYNRKTSDEEGRASAESNLHVEFLLIDEESGEFKEELKLDESELKCLDNVSFAVRNTAKIVDMPCNEMNVKRFIEEATSVCNELVKQKHDVSIEVIEGEELEKKGFGGIWNVGKAACVLPALVVLRYKPGDACEDRKNIAWVGKGIVFDTGGLSIKGRTFMCGMKRDCGGAAGILYAFYVAVTQGFKDNLSAVLCLAENSVSDRSMRVDDVIKLYSGKTVEVNNTDAEGRLVLGDGVAYAKKDLGCDIIVDMATLTGAQSIATGHFHAAVLTNDESYERKLMAAGKNSGDLTFPIVFAPELLFSEFNSPVADMKNSVADRTNAQSACAGLFIFSHIGFDFPGTWIHIDMAGPAESNDRGTGYGVMLLNTLFGDRCGDKSLFAQIAPKL